LESTHDDAISQVHVVKEAGASETPMAGEAQASEESPLDYLSGAYWSDAASQFCEMICSAAFFTLACEDEPAIAVPPHPLMADHSDSSQNRIENSLAAESVCQSSHSKKHSRIYRSKETSP
jgi:hypothetical protein